MLALVTKDGRKVGNAILYRIETDARLGKLYSVETDFGNHMRLTKRELAEMFSLGLRTDYIRWRNDRYVRSLRFPKARP